MAAHAKDVDWISVGRDYRAGILTDVAIGKTYGISHTAVQKRAKAENWTRDLSKRIDAAREAKVARAMVAAKVAAQRAATDEQVVEANAEMQAGIILAHRKDIGALKRTIVGMAGELGSLSNRELQDALELVLDEKTEQASDAYRAALNKAFAAALALGGRSSSGKNLVASLGILIDKERQAYGIDKAGSDSQLSSWLKAQDMPNATN